MTRTIFSGLLILILSAVVGCAGMAQNGAVARAQSGIQKGKYSFALNRLTDAERYKQPTPQLQAQILYLKAICYRGLGRQPEANALFQHIIDRYPETEYAALSKVQLAPANPSPAITSSGKQPMI